MFVVSEEAATSIRTAYEQEGELSAAIEVRRLFPGVSDNAKARACARSIAAWQTLPPKPQKPRVVSLRRAAAQPAPAAPHGKRYWTLLEGMGLKSGRPSIARS